MDRPSEKQRKLEFTARLGDALCEKPELMYLFVELTEKLLGKKALYHVTLAELL